MKKKLFSKSLVLALSASLSITPFVLPVKDVIAQTIKESTVSEFSEKDVLSDFVPGSIIVSLKDNKDGNAISEENSIDSLLKGIEVKSVENLTKKAYSIDEENENDLNLVLLTLKSKKKKDTIAAINQLVKNPEINYAEPDYITGSIDEDTTVEAVPNDPEYSSLYGIEKIGAQSAWSRATGSGVVVGVIDTGVDYNHEDLAQNMWKNPGEIPGDGIDNDKNGYIDDVYGYDFFNNDNDPMDDNSHGTHVSGTIAAVGNNGKGVCGVAYNAKICALKIFPASGKGTTSSVVIKAFEYAKNKGIFITNNSWSGTEYMKSVRDIINSYGLCIAASGNNGADIDKTPHYPACYDCENIISVGRTDKNDDLYITSNYGKANVDIVAPGSDIYSTVPGNKYDYKGGTSMATPHVAGAAALLKGYHTYLTAENIKYSILNGVDKIDSLKDKILTSGRLNVNHIIRNMCYYDGIDFSPVYNYTYYLNNNQDVKNVLGTNDVDVFKHFVTYGIDEVRRGNKEFIYHIYRNNYPDLYNAYGNTSREYYYHYISCGKKENRTASKVLYDGTSIADGVDYSDVYDFKYYVNKYTDVKDKFCGEPVQTLRHFLDFGMNEGRKASNTFDLAVYKANNPDLVTAYGNNNKLYYLHYITCGKKEGRIAY